MLPLTLPVWLFAHARIMESERHERQLARKKAGPKEEKQDVFAHLSHILSIKSYNEEAIVGFSGLSVACVGLQFSFVKLAELFAKGVGKLIGYLLDAGWVGVLWVLAGAWWLHIVYVYLFAINNLIVLPLINFRKGVGREFAGSAATGTERFVVHAPVHAILALLFQYTLWTGTIPYPTIWGWINYIKLDHIILQYSVYGSLVVGFILGACDITSVELIMLPVTLPIRIIENGKRMEKERHESELARRNAGVNAEAKRV
ncbi:hypothetical protein RQP46_007810 [Phenoliferia psychrophenolica]